MTEDRDLSAHGNSSSNVSVTVDGTFLSLAHSEPPRDPKEHRTFIEQLLAKVELDGVSVFKEAMRTSEKIEKLLDETRAVEQRMVKDGTTAKLLVLTPYLDKIFALLVEETELTKCAVEAFNNCKTFNECELTFEDVRAHISGAREQLKKNMSAVRQFTQTEVLERSAELIPIHVHVVCKAIQCICSLLSLYSADCDPKELWRAQDWLATAEEVLQSLSTRECEFISHTKANLPRVAHLTEECKEGKSILPEIKEISVESVI